MANFPGSLPSIPTSTAAQTLAAAGGIGHTALHNLINGEVLAIATKVGTGASTPASGQVLRGTGAGASAWGQVALASDVSGILPIANGGTGQNSLSGLTLPSSILSNPTISGTVPGGATYTSPILTSPTIADFSNATHTHFTNSQGGQLGTNAFQDDSVTPFKWTNPYCFRAYASAATTLVDNVATKIAFATEEYDYNGNFASSTYTIPVAGVYHFDAAFTLDSVVNGVYGNCRIRKNGSDAALGGLYLPISFAVCAASADLLCAAGDTIDIYGLQNSDGNEDVVTGSQATWFSGHLVRAT